MTHPSTLAHPCCSSVTYRWRTPRWRTPAQCSVAWCKQCHISPLIANTYSPGCAAGAAPAPLTPDQLEAPANQEKEVQYRITMLEEELSRMDVDLEVGGWVGGSGGCAVLCWRGSTLREGGERVKAVCAAGRAACERRGMHVCAPPACLSAAQGTAPSARQVHARARTPFPSTTRHLSRRPLAPGD